MHSAELFRQDLGVIKQRTAGGALPAAHARAGSGAKVSPLFRRIGKCPESDVAATRGARLQVQDESPSQWKVVSISFSGCYAELHLHARRILPLRKLLLDALEDAAPEDCR